MLLLHIHTTPVRLKIREEANNNKNGGLESVVTDAIFLWRFIVVITHEVCVLSKPYLKLH